VVKRYFNGARANPDWKEMESSEAKRERGRGWYSFCKAVRRERENKCEVCGVPELTREQRSLLTRKDRQRQELQLHHVKKLRTHRHLRFERGNVVVCCLECHKVLEDMADGGAQYLRPSQTQQLILPHDDPNSSRNDS
jgi:hypothetical protein